MGCFENMMKYIIFLFNFIFFVTGCVLIGVGAYVQVNMTEYFNFFGKDYVNSAITFIIIGVVIMVVAFFGCCGACTENHCMLYTYAVLMGLILLVEIGLAITIYLFKSQAKDIIKTGMLDSLNLYDGNGTDQMSHAALVNTWNAIQHDFQCCGVNDYTDWNQTDYGRQRKGVPDSCCKDVATTDCGKNVFKSTGTSGIYTDGCLNKMEEMIMSNVAAVAGVGCGIAVIQFIGVVMACCLAVRMRRKDNYV